MRPRGHPSRRIAAVSALVGVVAACTGGDPGIVPEPTPPTPGPGTPDPEEVVGRCPEGTDGTAVWVHDHEPPDLLVDPFDVRAVAGWIQHGVHEGLHRRDVDGAYRPQLLAGEAEEERDDDGRLRLEFELRDDLRFSDGTPLTAEHVLETYELLVADDGDGAARLGDPGSYERIDPDSWEVDGTTFAFTLDVEDAGWRTWFPRVLPTHVLPDLDAAVDALRELQVDGGPVPATGPFVATDWVRGEQLRFERNDEHHGPHPDREDLVNDDTACVAELELRFVGDAEDVVAALRDGSADLAFVTPQEQLVELDGRDTSVSVAPDAATESLLLNLSDPHLRDPRVRAALAAAIDRAGLVEAVHVPLLGDAVPPGGVGSALTGGDGQLDTAGEVGLGGGDVSRAEALLAEAGYDRDGDGVHSHPERGPLRLRLSTTGDDTLRERQQQLLQNRLAEQGWEITIDNRSGQEHLDEQLLAPASLACGATGEDGLDLALPSGSATAECDRFDVAQVSLQPSSWPVVAAERFRTGSGRDPTGLRSEAFDRLLDGCLDVVDEDEARDCVTRLDRTLVTAEVDPGGLAVVPLAARPHLHVDGPRVLRRADASPAADAGPLVDASQLVVRAEDPSA